LIPVTERDGAVLMSLEHGKANALDLELCEAIVQRMDELQDAPAVVLTGSGRIFSAGVDLKRLAAGGADYVRPFVAVLVRALERLFLYPRPLIAAINGHAIAGGCVLACACDWRIMGRGAGGVGVPELRVGVPFPDLVLEMMRACVPAQHLRGVVLRGEVHDSENSLRLGLVDELVEAGTEVEAALAVARDLGSLPREAYAYSKRGLARPALELLGARGREERERVVEMWCRPETLDAVRLYVERTLAK
jgi:enoyl-CoA hydratase